MTKIIRRFVPRPLRNALRKPRVTAARVLARTKNLFGGSDQVELSPGWNACCHPICIPEFSVFNTERTQRAELDQFVAECTAGMRLLDVGAHWGVFTLAALHFGGRDASSVCVEASTAAVRVLRRNLALNGLASRVVVVEAAAGAHDGELQMLTTGAGGADYFVVPAEPRPDAIVVRQVALTESCRALDFIPTHIKMDIEGFEEEGLIGARGLLLAKRPKLFLELHGDLIRRRHHDPLTVLQLLKQAGYSRWREGANWTDAKELERGGFNARLFCLPD